MRDFCKANQIWRKKFQRHLPRADSWLGSVTSDQWLQYWDFLSSTRCPEQYRLLVAFLSVFNQKIEYTYETKNVSIRLFLDLEFEFRSRKTRELDKIIEFVPPTIPKCTFVQFLDNEIETVKDVKNDIRRMKWHVAYYRYDRNADEEEWEAFIPHKVPDDAVSIIYKLIGMGYIPEDFQFKTITAHIGSACATCNAIGPKTVCGNCEQVLYCNQ